MPRQPINASSTALSFNGSTAFVLLKSGTILSGSTNASVSFWIKTSSVIDTNTFYCERAASGMDLWRIELNIGSGTVRFTFRDDAGTLSQIQGTTVVNNGKWHHILLTKAGTAVKTYIDGRLDLNSSVTGTDAFTNSGIQTFAGKDTLGSANSFYNGLMDELRIYNTTLTQADASNLYNYASITAGLVGWYEFDEGSGSIATDRTGASNGAITAATYVTGVVPTGPRTVIGSTRTVAGARQTVRNFSSCLSFNGSASVTFASYPANLQLTNLTYTAWIRPIYAHTGAIIGGTNISGGAPEFRVGSSQQLDLVKANVIGIGSTANGIINPGLWQHVACTYSSAGVYAIYLNGVSVASGTNLQTFSYAGNNFRIGSYELGSPERFIGLLDNVRVYGSVLTSTDITNLYHGLEPSATPVSWWKFDEGSGTTANDSGSGGNTGTISTATYSTDVFVVPRTVTS